MQRFGTAACLWMLLCGSAALAAGPDPARGPMVGEPAPPLEVEEWLGSAKAERFEPGRVYVVDIWAPWCGPCVGGMPHLSDLQRRFEGRGLTVVGLTGDDDYGSSKEKARGVLAKLGDRVVYANAWDRDRATYRRWMARESGNGWPWCFVVDRAGRLAWSGHPERLDAVLMAVLDGRWNLDSARVAYRAHAGALDRSADFYQLYRAKRWREALPIYDEVRALDPEVAATYAPHAFKARLIGLGSRDAAGAFAREAMSGFLATRAGTLIRIADIVADSATAPALRDLDLALALAARADSLSDSKDSGILASRARIHALRGEWSAAVAAQRRAIANAEEGDRAAMSAALASYQSRQLRPRPR